jgi:hypothetical protein
MKKLLTFAVAASLLANVGSRIQGQDGSQDTVLTVALDVKPESCPNPLNTRSRGVLPVAILGSEEFEVSEIDPTSLLLEGVRPTRSKLEDVAAPVPFTGAIIECTDCTEEGPDGLEDLTLKFDTQDLVAALGEVADGEARILTLTGNLKPEFGGTPISGVDVVCLKRKNSDFDGDGEIGFRDFLAFARKFGIRRGRGNYDPAFDLDDDGEIGFGDLIQFALEYGSGATKPVGVTKPVTPTAPASNGSAGLALSAAVDPGSGEMEVNVHVTNAFQVQGFKFEVVFDGTVLEFLGASSQVESLFERAADTDGVALQASPAAGQIVLADVLPQDTVLEGDADLAALRFKVLDRTLPGYVEVAEALVSDGAGNIQELVGTRLEDPRSVPAEYAVFQNYPNPFNPTTQIGYQLPEAGEVSLVVYNVLGQQVRALVHGHQAAGFHRVMWDGKDDLGRGSSSGIYLYRFVSEGLTQTSRMILLK